MFRGPVFVDVATTILLDDRKPAPVPVQVQAPVCTDVCSSDTCANDCHIAPEADCVSIPATVSVCGEVGADADSNSACEQCKSATTNDDDDDDDDGTRYVTLDRPSSRGPVASEIDREGGSDNDNDNDNDKSSQVDVDVEKDEESSAPPSPSPVVASKTISPTTQLSQDVEFWTVTKLVQECKTRGLAYKGNKATLVQRLRDHLAPSDG